MGLVVGAALVRDGRVLAARRTWPAEHAGRWELPGGKVEAGESPEAALVRELHEELGVTATPLRWLDGEQPVAGGRHTLRCALATLADGSAEPAPVDHDALRWLGADELDPAAPAVDWLEPDRPFLAEVRAHLRTAHLRTAPLQTGPVRTRGIFFDEDDARAVARQLLADGFDADVERERPFAGEDDDEDHPWAVTTDAPDFVLEILVDRHDGWLDVPDTAGPAGPAGPQPPAHPLRDLPALPDAPRRLKRPPV